MRGAPNELMKNAAALMNAQLSRLGTADSSNVEIRLGMVASIGHVVVTLFVPIPEQETAASFLVGLRRNQETRVSLYVDKCPAWNAGDSEQPSATQLPQYLGSVPNTMDFVVPFEMKFNGLRQLGVLSERLPAPVKLCRGVTSSLICGHDNPRAISHGDGKPFIDEERRHDGLREAQLHISHEVDFSRKTLT